MCRRFRSRCSLILVGGILAATTGIHSVPGADGNEAGIHETGIKVRRIGEPVLGTETTSLATFVVENGTDSDVDVKIDWSLQLNSNMFDELPPHPTLGYDHATGAKCKVVVDGQDKGNALLTDGNEFTAFETPWGQGYREAIVDIDLGQSRSIRSIEWLAADATWIWLTDLSTSVDGTNYTPQDSVQHFEMHKKWGLRLHLQHLLLRQAN